LNPTDGKHIAIGGREDYASYYFNYKHFNSIVLLAVVDADCKFLYVSAGTNGRVNDAAVFNNSSLKKAIDEDTLDFPNPEPLPGKNCPRKLALKGYAIFYSSCIPRLLPSFLFILHTLIQSILLQLLISYFTYSVFLRDRKYRTVCLCWRRSIQADATFYETK